MTFIGIDPAAESFTAARYPEGKPHHFDNNAEGSAALLAWLRSQHLTPEQTRICIENTGVYDEQLCYWLDQQGWPVFRLEPIKVWRAFRESAPKTDAIDSLKIAEYGYRYQDKLPLWKPNTVIVEQIKVLLATREQLLKQKTALGNTRRALSRKVVQTPTANASLEESIAYLKCSGQDLI